MLCFDKFFCELFQVLMEKWKKIFYAAFQATVSFVQAPTIFLNVQAAVPTCYAADVLQRIPELINALTNLEWTVEVTYSVPVEQKRRTKMRMLKASIVKHEAKTTCSGPGKWIRTEDIYSVLVESQLDNEDIDQKTWCVLQIIHPPPLSTSSYYLDMSAFLLSLVVQNKVCNPFIFLSLRKMKVFFLLSPSFPIGQTVCGAALKKNLSCSLVEGAILEQKKAYFHWWRASFSSLSNSYSNKFFFQSKQPSPLSLFVCSSLLRSEWALIYFASLLIFAKKWGGNLRNCSGEYWIEVLEKCLWVTQSYTTTHLYTFMSQLRYDTITKASWLRSNWVA